MYLSVSGKFACNNPFLLMTYFSNRMAGICLAIVLLAGNAVSARRQCGYHHIQALYDSHPDIAQQHLAARAVMIAEANAARERGALSKETGTIVTIPIVFHVELTAAQLDSIGGAAGVAARCASQITVLNRDYSATNTDLSHAPAPFLAIASATNLRFGLAHTDPSGNATPGYEIKIITANGFDENTISYGGEAKHAATGGLDAWDNSKYLNIWVMNFLDGTQPSYTLGLTISFQTANDYPNTFAANEVGVQVNYGSFGLRTGAISATNYYTNLGAGDHADGGRTLTHELGHCFEMIHIWGDDNGACPGSANYTDDGITDTPPQADANYNIPAYPHISCTVANEPHGDIFMDYMDYTDDTVMHLFTAGQAAVMNLLVTSGHESYSLTQHPALLQYPSGTGVGNVATTQQPMIYPNPATSAVTVSFAQNPDGLKMIAVTNLMGQQMLQMTSDNSGIYHLDLSSFAKGIYFVRCQFSGGSVTQKIVLQ